MPPGLAVTIGLLVASAAGGCAAADGGGSDAWPPERTFLSTSVTEAGRVRPLVPGTRVRLTLGPDGHLGADAGCNSLTGQARIVDGRLVLDGGLGQTEMACDPPRMDQDAWLAAFLTASPTWRLSGDDLVLTGGAVVISLTDRRVVEPDLGLAGTTWVVDTMIDGDTASSAPSGQVAWLRFDGAGRFDGATGCAPIHGTAVTGPGVIAIGVDASPACGDERHRALHAAVLATLVGEVDYRIESSRLTLTGPGGAGLGLMASPGPTASPDHP